MNVQRRRMRGMTLAEVMMALGVMAVLLLAAVPSMRAYKRNAELGAAANTLVASINTVRGEAMKRGVDVLLVPAAGGSDWRAGWFAFADPAGKRTHDGSASALVLSSAALPPTINLTGNGIAAGAMPYVLFNASGYPKTKSGAFGAVTFTLTRTDLPASSPPGQTRRVILSSTGRVRACRPAGPTDIDCPDAGGF